MARNRDSGASSPDLFKSADLDGSSLRTSHPCFIAVTLWCGVISELLDTELPDPSSCPPRRLVRPTAGRGSGSWPTAQAMDAMNFVRDNPPLHKGGCANLREHASHWATPRREDSEATGPHRGAADTMPSQAKAWTTPTAQDCKPAGPVELAEIREAGARNTVKRLRVEAASAFGTTGAPSEEPMAPSGSSHSKPWQTPDAQGFHSRKQVGASEREMLLTGEAKAWATPNVPSGGRGTAHAERIRGTLYHKGKKVQEGIEANAKAMGKGSLNPAFTLALMGFPPEWFRIGVMIQRAKPKRPKGKGRPKA